MSITASMVKELREQTGAGMMECKKALTETHGNIQAAIEFMRKKGMANADKKASRIAAEGVIALAKQGRQAVLVEVNSETDFVAKSDDFLLFTQQVADLALAHANDDINTLMRCETESGTLEDKRRALIAKIGENINVRRACLLCADTVLGVYQHGSKIAVLVALSGSDDVAVAKDVAHACCRLQATSS